MPRGPNPFRPGFGISPRVLAGRDDLLTEFGIALDEGPGSPLRSVLVSGARGMGKTVVLNELEDLAMVRGVAHHPTPRDHQPHRAARADHTAGAARRARLLARRPTSRHRGCRGRGRLDDDNGGRALSGS